MFYGDEKKIAGLTEPEYRSPMDWQSQDEEFEVFIKKVLSIRKEYINASSGYEAVQAEKGSRLYSFVRTGEKARVLACLNAGEDEEIVNIPEFAEVLSECDVIEIDKNKVRISAYGFGIYVLK